MDMRSWPWKKKSSDRTVTSIDTAGNQENSKNIATYVQISQERYAHLSGLDDQVKVLNEKLSTALAEMTAKENLVKQHAKVAEEAVSGWEKAEAEASALKSQLESVTLLKLTVEERAVHLDGALKECMKQVRNVKEEGEQKLHDVIFSKTKHWEEIKSELEAKIDAFEQELIRCSAENDALSRTIQERSNMLIKISKEKSQADAEIEVLKANIQSCEKEISSMKYEVHISSKELEIRNEEKNMSVRSAEVANRQHLEDVKKIAKLEAECQRLRGLVRKKLPGPAALAQMKLEVESYGREYADSRLRKKCSSPRLGPLEDIANDNILHFQKENEYLTARLVAMEEETQMLKEALSKRNSELQASRSMFAKTATKLRSVEAHSSKFHIHIPMESPLSQHESNAPSITSMSEDGIDEEGSCFESWNGALTSEIYHSNKNKGVDKLSRSSNSNNLDLMDDFLEMEKLACISTESNGTISLLNGTRERNVNTSMPTNIEYSNGEQVAKKDSTKHEAAMSKLLSKISLLLELHGKNGNVGTFVEDIRHILHDVQEELPQHSESCIIEEVSQLKSTSRDHDPSHGKRMEITGHGNSVADAISKCAEMKDPIAENLEKAIANINDFVVSLGKYDMQMPAKSTSHFMLDRNIKEFSVVISNFHSTESSMHDLILALSNVLSKIKDVNWKMPMENEGENYSDCIDKVTLLENKVIRHKPVKDGFTYSSPDSEIPPEVRSVPGVGECSLEDFEQVKREKDSFVMDLARCTEILEQTKCQLLESEQQVIQLKSQLSNSEKSYSLAETQLKCMAESYKSLEARCQDLEMEINLLRKKGESLEHEIQEERKSHQDDLVKYEELQEKMERMERCPIRSEVDADVNTKQEREIAAAAEKLAECQETILLLGKQLKTLHPQSDLVASSPSDAHRVSASMLEDILSNNAPKQQGGWHGSQHSGCTETENLASLMQRTGGDSPFDTYNSNFSPLDNEAIPKKPKHRSTLSSSSSSSFSTSEKKGRGFSRFFSKGKSDR